MCFPTWTAVVVAIVSLVVPSGLLASCSAVDCSKTGNDATFVGRLTLSVRARQSSPSKQ